MGFLKWLLDMVEIDDEDIPEMAADIIIESDDDEDSDSEDIDLPNGVTW